MASYNRSASVAGTAPYREKSYFEQQREELLSEIAMSFEHVLANINKLNRSLEAVIAVGNEFSSVEALWSTFENVMAKDEEEPQQQQQQQEEEGQEEVGEEHEEGEEGEDYDEEEGQNEQEGGEEGEEQTGRYDDDGDEEMEDLTEVDAAQPPPPPPSSSRQRHLQSQYGGRGSAYRR